MPAGIPAGIVEGLKYETISIFQLIDSQQQKKITVIINLSYW